MAANYWTSTQRKFWTFSPEKLAEIRDDLEKANAKVFEQYPYPDRRHVLIFIRDRLLQLAKRLQFRQQCVATALVYLQRYFLSTPMQNVNLYLLVATAFYLSSKTEESPHHIRLVAAEARQSWPEFVPGDVSRLGEMEFCLISDMRSQLIVWHPYRSLIALKENQDLKLSNDELGLAWSIINDSFMTDLPLTCPPHLTAVIAMFLAVVFLPTAKATGTLRPLPHDTLANPDSAPFSSLGGRQNMSVPFNNVLGNLQLSGGQQQQQGSSQNNNNNNPTNGKAPVRPSQSSQELSSGGTTQSDKEKAIAAIKESEKMQNLIKFLVESGVDIQRVIEGTQEMISLYDAWEQYNEKAVKDVVARCLKSRGLDN
jgi:cyclin C